MVGLMLPCILQSSVGCWGVWVAGLSFGLEGLGSVLGWFKSSGVLGLRVQQVSS